MLSRRPAPRHSGALTSIARRRITVNKCYSSCRRQFKASRRQRSSEGPAVLASEDTPGLVEASPPDHAVRLMRPIEGNNRLSFQRRFRRRRSEVTLTSGCSTFSPAHAWSSRWGERLTELLKLVEKVILAIPNRAQRLEQPDGLFMEASLRRVFRFGTFGHVDLARLALYGPPTW